MPFLYIIWVCSRFPCCFFLSCIQRECLEALWPWQEVNNLLSLELGDLPAKRTVQLLLIFPPNVSCQEAQYLRTFFVHVTCGMSLSEPVPRDVTRMWELIRRQVGSPWWIQMREQQYKEFEVVLACTAPSDISYICPQLIFVSFWQLCPGKYSLACCHERLHTYACPWYAYEACIIALSHLVRMSLLSENQGDAYPRLYPSESLQMLLLSKL